MDADREPADDPAPSPAGSGPVTAAGALGAADAAARMGIRRHPLVRATILSNFVVRAVEIAAAINRGRHGNVDRPLIRASASDLQRDLGRARQYALARHLKLNVTVAGESLLVFTPDPERELNLGLFPMRYFSAALELARELSHAIDATLDRQLDLRLGFSRDEDLELACQLADGLESALSRAVELALGLAREVGQARDGIRNVNQAREQVFYLDQSISRTLDLALERSRTLDWVCVQSVAGRVGIAPVEGMAQALLDGAMDDFTSADLKHANLADADLTGVRWSLSGTIWPPGTRVKAILARSEAVEPGGGVYVVTRRGIGSPFPVQ